MSEKTSRLLLILEAVVIVFPLSGLAVIATAIFVLDMFKYQQISVMALGVLAIVSLSAIGSGWRLFIIYLRNGIDGLQSQPFGWWTAIFLGVLVLIGSFISNVLPPSPEYSRMWSFRLEFNLFVSGWPLLVPFGHLGLERLRRKKLS